MTREITGAEREGAAVAANRSAIAFEQIGDALHRLAQGLAAMEGRLETEAVEIAAAAGGFLRAGGDSMNRFSVGYDQLQADWEGQLNNHLQQLLGSGGSGFFG